MKLNIGCGHRRMEGYTGVDAVERPGADIIAPAHNIPLADGCADEILAIHLLEHLLPWEAPLALREWHRLLKFGGRLVLELPNLRKCCENVISGRAGKHPNQLGMWGLFGDNRLEDPFMMHRWGYTPETLSDLLRTEGFTVLGERKTQFHPAGREHRDMRIEALKGT